MSLDVLCLEADSMPESPRTFSRDARSKTDCADASATTDKPLRPASCDVMLKSSWSGQRIAPQVR